MSQRVFSHILRPVVNFEALLADTERRLKEISEAPPSELTAVRMEGGGHMMVVRPIDPGAPDPRRALRRVGL